MRYKGNEVSLLRPVVMSPVFYYGKFIEFVIIDYNDSIIHMSGNDQ